MKNRIQMAWLCAAATLALPAGGIQGAVTAASVERKAPNTYEINWTSDRAAEPVAVYLAGKPDAPASERKLLFRRSAPGREVVQTPAGGRPYFYIEDEQGSGLWTAERVLPLAGGRNFRDLGGYAAADGRRVKWGKVFRSGSMAKLTPADYDYLSRLGVKVVCDFRTSPERASEPNRWPEAAKIDYWYREYDMGFGEFSKLLEQRVSAAQMKAVMTEGYRRMPEEQAEAYKEMFQRLLAGEVPLAFNCTAGKDRTGVAAALLLSALGVPRDVIVEDYALSEKIVDFQKELVTKGEDGALGFLASLPPETVAPLLRTDPDYIIATFTALDSKYGSVEGYLRTALGLSGDDLQQLRDSLLE